jgi:hypothetical protein
MRHSDLDFQLFGHTSFARNKSVHSPGHEVCLDHTKIGLCSLSVEIRLSAGGVDGSEREIGVLVDNN